MYVQPNTARFPRCFEGLIEYSCLLMSYTSEGTVPFLTKVSFPTCILTSVSMHI